MCELALHWTDIESSCAFKLIESMPVFMILRRLTPTIALFIDVTCGVSVVTDLCVSTDLFKSKRICPQSLASKGNDYYHWFCNMTIYIKGDLIVKQQRG